MTKEEYIEIYKAHQGLIGERIQKRLYDKSYAEDLTQEIWLKVWSARKTFDPSKSNITTWLYTVANSVIDSFLEKHFEKQPEQVLDSQLTPPRQETDDGSVTYEGSWIEETVESPYTTAEEFETLDQLVYSGSTLSEQEAAVFNLVYWHGKSYDFVAKKFGIDVRTVGAVVTRLRDKIERGMRPANDVPRYYPPGNVWGDWSWKPEGLANQLMG